MKKSHLLKHRLLVTAIGATLVATAAYGQSTTSSIYGQVPAGSGSSVQVRSTTGVSRVVAVDSSGHYNAAQLPVGTYSVSLVRDGKVVETQDNVVLHVGVGQNVSFAAKTTTELAGVNVSAQRTPSIDVTSVDSRTVITSEQLHLLPLGRSAEAAALLAPGVVPSTVNRTGRFGNPLVSFGGAAVVENQYYVNGFNTTDPNQGQGGLTLPYGAIDQEELFTGGYGAKYGRSEGGVLNIIGKSGTNDWHFGGEVQMMPQSFQASQSDLYYSTLPAPKTPATGMLYNPRSRNDSATYTYDAYVGGPILRDKLFFFLAAEQSRIMGESVGTVTSDNLSHNTTTNPKLYAKINWNITKSQLLELTGDYNDYKTSGTSYHYNYLTNQQGAFKAYNPDSKTGGRFWSAKYTGYLTDNLTVTAQYGKMNLTTQSLPVGLNATDPLIADPNNENPALNGGNPILGSQTLSVIGHPTHYITTPLRIDVNWVVGSHSLSAGIDDLTSDALSIGSQVSTGPGYSWDYGLQTPATTPILAPYVPAPAGFANGAGGYYVIKNTLRTGGDLHTFQRAQYLEDNWNVTDRLLLSLGLRHDGFVNKNTHQDTYVKQDNLWQPRLGFSWDVNGDSSLKVFGNLGRYDMDQPLSTDANLANTALRLTQYFTYSGIDSKGQPTGLTALSTPFSINGNYGQSPDPRQVYVKNLKPQAQDEFILGFAKELDAHLIVGAKFTRRMLRSDIDDYCDTQKVIDMAAAQGFTPAVIPGQCWQINPGSTNTFAVKDSSGIYHDVRITRGQMGFPKLARNYNSLNLFVEHRFDGRWYGKLDYTWSQAYGDTEGQSQTRTDSVGGAQQTDWDNPAVMDHSNGPFGYDHTHQIKAFGYYQLTPEWQLAGNLTLISGGPKFCLGKYGPNLTTPFGYTTFYWCNGQPAPPGSQGRMPWNKQLDLGVHYRPSFAGGKLGFHFDVFNVFNSQVALNEYWRYRPDRPQDLWPLFHTVTNSQAPRSARFTVTYDY